MLNELNKKIQEKANPSKAEILQRFFKQEKESMEKEMFF